MIAASWRDRVFVMPALLTDIAPYSPHIETDCTALRLVNRLGSWRAVSWPSVSLPDRQAPVTVCEATVLEVREDLDREPMALVHWQPMDETRLFDLLPDDLCPIPSVVVQTCELLRSIVSQPLRRLMAAALRMPDVHANYWIAPASLSHHHAMPGGLAQHSLEVAVATSSVRGLDPWQRDLVMTYALLHDLGKVWAYADGRLTDEARRLSHEALGYRELQRALASLQVLDERSHEALDALLSGAWKRTCRHPAAALGEIVRAMDRFSAARGVGNAPYRVDQ
ncbi:MAG: HD domain-containing protein [Pseudomarimonas sp.]